MVCSMCSSVLAPRSGVKQHNVSQNIMISIFFSFYPLRTRNYTTYAKDAVKSAQTVGRSLGGSYNIAGYCTSYFANINP